MNGITRSETRELLALIRKARTMAAEVKRLEARKNENNEALSEINRAIFARQQETQDLWTRLSDIIWGRKGGVA